MGEQGVEENAQVSGWGNCEEVLFIDTGNREWNR